MSRTRITVAAAAVAAFVAGCGGTATPGPSPSPSVSPAASSPGATATASSPAQARTAQVGATFTIKAEDGTAYDVTLLSLAQQASPGGEFETPSAGKHLAAAEFRISASTRVDENANNNATAVGDNQQIYTASAVAVAEGTNFDYGQIRLQPGASSIGWVSYEIPDGVAVAKVAWTASSGFSSATCEWLVPSASSVGPLPGLALRPSRRRAGLIRRHQRPQLTPGVEARRLEQRGTNYGHDRPHQRTRGGLRTGTPAPGDRTSIGHVAVLLHRRLGDG